ncbi:MAG: hypothetical protein JWQ64_2609 [Subtercola sp.]|nr:hypothetical protein [Subtercola sp.]
MSRRLVSRSLGRWVDPALAFEVLYGDAQTAFWLDSGVDARSGTTYIGAASGCPAVVVSGASVLDVISAELERQGENDVRRRATAPDIPAESDVKADANAEAGAPPPAFRLGWVGWLAYDLDDSRFMFVDRAIAFDHAARTVTLLALEAGSSPAQSRSTDPLSTDPLSTDAPTSTPPTSLSTLTWLSTTSARLLAADASITAPHSMVRDQERRANPSGERQGGEVRWRHRPAEYLQLIRECQALIGEGEAYQLCLTNEITVDVHPEPLEVYAKLRMLNPTHHGGYLRFGDVALLSSSPEQFLEVTAGGAVMTKPIKGTRPRGETPERDAELRDELLESEKERAENVMIVDLMRNDLGKVARTGSVRVSKLFDVESYSTVHQLVSTVTAELADGLTGVDAVRASFPAGSMTGAPKISAMQILRRLENGRRGVYAGAFGYFGLDGRVDLAMSIRSIVLTPAGASIGTGGGITALSTPDDELAEIEVKAAALLAALGVDAR